MTPPGRKRLRGQCNWERSTVYTFRRMQEKTLLAMTAAFFCVVLDTFGRVPKGHTMDPCTVSQVLLGRGCSPLPDGLVPFETLLFEAPFTLLLFLLVFDRLPRREERVASRSPSPLRFSNCMCLSCNLEHISSGHPQVAISLLSITTFVSFFLHTGMKKGMLMVKTGPPKGPLHENTHKSCARFAFLE